MFQTGFFRTSISELFEISGPMLRLDRLDSRRDLTTGKDIEPPNGPVPVWTTRLTGTSPAARSHSSSSAAGSSMGSEERLHVVGRGAFTNSRISSRDRGFFSVCPDPLPIELSSARVTFSTPPVPGLQRWKIVWAIIIKGSIKKTTFIYHWDSP